ncbi:MAG: P-II family nitrogen regulator [Chthoniobacteraceae bacterium]
MHGQEADSVAGALHNREQVFHPAHTGKIFVSHVEDAIRIRTDEHGDGAV